MNFININPSVGVEFIKDLSILKIKKGEQFYFFNGKNRVIEIPTNITQKIYSLKVNNRLSYVKIIDYLTTEPIKKEYNLNFDFNTTHKIKFVEDIPWFNIKKGQIKYLTITNNEKFMFIGRTKLYFTKELDILNLYKYVKLNKKDIKNLEKFKKLNGGKKNDNRGEIKKNLE